jgi:hypothetical protein
MDTPHDRRPPPQDWAQRLGWFRFYFDDGGVWSPQVERMYGYPPGTVAPDVELALSHIHPDDYRPVADALYRMRSTHQPFSSRHRVVDARNHTHDVAMIGAPFYDRLGAPAGLHGFCFDMTSAGPVDGQEPVVARLRRQADAGDVDGQRHRVRAATQC